MSHNLFNTLQTFKTEKGKSGQFYSLPQLEQEGVGPVSRLPVSIRIVLESVLRNFDGKRRRGGGRAHARQLAGGRGAHGGDSLHRGARAVAGLHRRAAAGRPRRDALGRRSAWGATRRSSSRSCPSTSSSTTRCRSTSVEPPTRCGSTWRSSSGATARATSSSSGACRRSRAFNVVPPGIGIVHQVNLEYLARGVMEKDGVYYPDTLVGTDSHTTMINGLGIVGWGVGGIEAEAGDARPARLLPDARRRRREPDRRSARGRDGHRPRAARHGDAARRRRSSASSSSSTARARRRIPVADRATIGNMAPEYGATMGFFPVDEKTLRVPARDRARRGAGRRLPRLLPGAGAVRHPARGRDRLQHDARARPRDRRAERRRAEAPAGSHRASGAQGEVLRPPAQARRRERLQQARRSSWRALPRRPEPRACTRSRALPCCPARCTRAAASRSPRQTSSPPRRSEPRHAQREEHERGDRVRDDEQPPDARPRRRRGADGRVPVQPAAAPSSATATWSSPPSPPARTPRTRA